MKERSLRDLFHLVKQVVPEHQEGVEKVSPETPVSQALTIMRTKALSQLPVVAGREVLGVFSYRSFAEKLTGVLEKERNPMALPVEEFLEDLRFVTIHDELSELLDELDLKDAVLVGTQERLSAIVTTIDALRYFYRVASPYVLLREIELAIRELIRVSVDEESLHECIEMTLKQYYDGLGKSLPNRLEDLSLNDYVMLLRFQGIWHRFQKAFGGTSNIVYAKLESLPGLRNDVFHFKRELNVDEYETLRETRDWLLKRIRRVEGSKRKSSND